MTRVVKIRAHHLDGAKSVHGTSRDLYKDVLWEGGYLGEGDVDNLPEHPFVSVYDVLINLFSNPERKLRIVNDEVDFICKKCLFKRKNKCEINETEFATKLYGKAFLDNYDSKDSVVARRYGLEDGQFYSVQKLREIVGF